MNAGRRTSRSRGLGLAGALVLDRVLGQPRLHPVRAIGVLLGGARRLRRSRGPVGSLVEGAAALAVLSGVAAAASRSLAALPGRPSRESSRFPLPATLLGAGTEALLLHPALALEALADAGKRVGAALETGDLERARRSLAWDLVSRDTGALDASLCASAAIESMAENLCDSVVAPACAYLAAGLPGAWVYRVVNTADAMFGYRTPDLLWYGKPAARADDLLNFVPARLAAALIVMAAAGRPLPRDRSRPALPEVLRRLPREASRAAGPNAGWPMAAAALALGVRLRKSGTYTLNTAGAPPEADDVDAAATLIRRAAWLGIGLVAAAAACRS
ncbi:MAG: adenosylcobinamide-phosphate synthase CbiB [Gammaproteobacteria bacterium]|nr:adenosylcobinamide-phosphate synthase CbiB [Gammaproteobacteria bacterium]MDE2881522.1 adenosylcobinamide-phosphate synthase CbiB [Acidobacteriota bacterium]